MQRLALLLKLENLQKPRIAVIAKSIIFHPISRCGNFAESHSLRIVLGESPETMRKLCLQIKFLHQEIGEITVFFAVTVFRSESPRIERRNKGLFC